MAEVDPAVAAAAAAAYEDDEDDEDNIDDEDEDEDEPYFNDENVDVAAAVAAAAAANDGTAELAAATDAVLQRDLPQRPCAGINEFLSVIGAEPLLRSLNHAGRAGVARWSQTRVEAARSVLLDQLGFDGARVERASRNLESAARAALEGDGGVGIKNARFKMLVRLVPRSEQKKLGLLYARALERDGSLSPAL